MMLKRHGFAITVQRMDLEQAFSPLAAAATTSPAHIDQATRIVRSVHALGPRIGARCLPQSLAAGRMMRSQGIDAHIRIGVARSDNGSGVHAHAWIELDGCALGEESLSMFEPFTPDQFGHAISALIDRIR